MVPIWRNIFLILATQGLLVSSAVQFFLYTVPVPGSTLGGSQIISHNSIVTPLSNYHFQMRNVHDGSYHFGYDTDQSYREEKRDALGVVSGRYGYLDPNGIHRMVEYWADKNGYRARENQFFVKPITQVFSSPASAPQPSTQPPSPPPPQQQQRQESPIQIIGPIPKPLSQFF